MNESEEKKAFGIIEMMLTAILTLQGYQLWWMNGLDKRTTVLESSYHQGGRFTAENGEVHRTLINANSLALQDHIRKSEPKLEKMSRDIEYIRAWIDRGKQ